jgi:hypothetical protein
MRKTEKGGIGEEKQVLKKTETSKKYENQEQHAI